MEYAVAASISTPKAHTADFGRAGGHTPMLQWNLPPDDGSWSATHVQIDNIIAVKEAGNNMAQYYDLLKHKPADFHVISGDDDLALGVAIAGGSGVISVIGQALPSEFSEMIRLGLKGNSKDAFKIHYDLMAITKLIFSENNPAGIKAVLSALDISDSFVRLPLVEATSVLKIAIQEELQHLGKR